MDALDHLIEYKEKYAMSNAQLARHLKVIKTSTVRNLLKRKTKLKIPAAIAIARMIGVSVDVVVGNAPHTTVDTSPHDLNNIRHHLRQHVISNGLTGLETANAIGVSRVTGVHYTTTRNVLYIETIKRISKLTGMSIEELIRP